MEDHPWTLGYRGIFPFTLSHFEARGGGLFDIARSYFLGLGGKSRSDSRGQAVPSLRFLTQAFAAHGRKFIELRPAVILGCTPACFQDSLAHETEQRGIECSLFDEQGLPGDLPDSQQDSVTMKRPERDRFQNEKIESSRQKLSLTGHALTPKILRNVDSLS